MKVRDHTKSTNDYQGRLTEACDSVCPCRPCFWPHDYGRSDWSGRHVVEMRCNTRERGGCPQPLPAPEHVFASDRAQVCKHCGMRRPKRVSARRTKEVSDDRP